MLPTPEEGKTVAQPEEGKKRVACYEDPTPLPHLSPFFTPLVGHLVPVLIYL